MSTEPGRIACSRCGYSAVVRLVAEDGTEAMTVEEYMALLAFVDGVVLCDLCARDDDETI